MKKEIDKNRTHVMMYADTGELYLWAKKYQGPVIAPKNQERRGMEQIPPQYMQKEPALMTPRFLTSGLQNGERKNFCCLNNPVCRTMFWQS
jgi:hypothetical protein